jgi:nucleotide-binding universal stress UspA family protein
MFNPRVVLHPTDYSDCARHAFDLAVELARDHGSRLIVLHVAETLGAETVSYGEAVSRRQPSGHVQHLWDQLHHVAPPPESGVEVQHILAEGDPGQGIARVAREHHCDLVVMGTYGRSALSRLLTGSVTQKVYQLVECAVVTVRTPAHVHAHSQPRK